MASETAPPGYFNVHKNKDSREKAGRTTFVSPSDSIASTQGHAMAVSFRHEQSGKSVFFKAYFSLGKNGPQVEFSRQNIIVKNSFLNDFFFLHITELFVYTFS